MVIPTEIPEVFANFTVVPELPVGLYVVVIENSIGSSELLSAIAVYNCPLRLTTSPT